MIQIEKIKAEIERRIAYARKTQNVLHQDDIEATMAYAQKQCLRRLLSFIDTLEQEPSLPSNVDEAAEEFAEEEWDGLHDNDGNPLYTADYVEYAFKKGAEWRDAQIPKLPSTLEEAAKYHRAHGLYGGDINLAMEDSFKKGAKWMASQGETLEGKIVKDMLGFLCAKSKAVSRDKYTLGDKVIVQIRKK